MPNITTYLWFDKNAEEAMEYYTSVFPDSKIVNITRYPEDMQVGPVPDMGGKVLNGTFELAGQRFYCIDGGPYFTFNEAISLMVECKDQKEIDYYWEKLSHVPESEQCGWCKDQFGLSWQVIPASMADLMDTPEAVQAMLKMKKIVIADLEAAGRK
jgi:predicted 3-demethylubiquinone-9 3-methyltransferase (glyoxalase superfamily)